MAQNKTLTDIAQVAGVSESTVSRALNDSPLVSEKTKQKIRKIAAELNFTVNTTARNLRLKRTNTVAVTLMIDSDSDQSTSDPFILSLLGVVADELKLLGYDMLLVPNSDKQSLKQLYDSKRVDGIIVFGQGDKNDFYQSDYKGAAMVTWGEIDQEKRYLTVGTNNQQGGLLATKHLLEQGCKNIAFAGHVSYETGLRFAGYKDALRTVGLHYSHHLDVHFSYAEAYRITLELLQNNAFHYDGIVAACDTIALGMMKALNEHGLQVPQQVAIVGYDDIEVAAFSHPSLTTVRQDTKAGGKLLVQTLMALINGDTPQSQSLDTYLVVRGSSQSTA